MSKFIGTGFAFPFEASPTGSIEKLKDETNEQQVLRINHSIMQILATKKGERFFLRDFGSRLHDLVFEPNDEILEGMARKYVIEDIEDWEKRIIVKEAEATADRIKNILFIKISYVIRSSNVEGNFVFPFFLDFVS